MQQIKSGTSVFARSHRAFYSHTVPTQTQPEAHFFSAVFTCEAAVTASAPKQGRPAARYIAPDCLRRVDKRHGGCRCSANVLLTLGLLCKYGASVSPLAGLSSCLFVSAFWGDERPLIVHGNLLRGGSLIVPIILEARCGSMP